MTLAVDHYDRLLARHYTWMLGGDLAAVADEQERLLREAGVGPLPRGERATAVDLGCGPGSQSLALARLGFSPVLAVDTSQTLLGELAAAAGEDTGIRPVLADLRGALPRLVTPGSVTAVVCMGDTLPHLPSKADVAALLDDVARALRAGGRLVVSYRDLTRPLTGTDRFLPVRATEDRLLTCFLEYRDGSAGGGGHDGSHAADAGRGADDGGEDTVLVHDLLHTRSGGTWTQQISSYPKLRIAPAWLAAGCAGAGLRVERDEAGPRGLRLLSAVKTHDGEGSERVGTL